MKSNKKVLAIGLDAAELSLIEKWMAEGYLKNLASLRTKSAFGRLSSSADWLVGSTWPTFYTGTLPSTHGFYHYLQWRGAKMDYDRPNPEWISANPFWRQLDENYRVIAVDIPLTFPPTPFNGIEISGWASHDRIYPTSSFPKEKIKWVIKNFGRPPISDEVGGLQEMSELSKLKDELINANQKEAELITSLISSEEWNLFLCCFTSTHRGGHKFWTLSDANHEITNVKGEFNESQKLQFKNSLKDIYQSCDDAIGKIIECVDDDVTILIFSLHGMSANINLSDKMLPQMISNILNGERKLAANENKSIIKSIRNLIPLELRSSLRKLLPYWLQDKMTAYWRMGKIDWTATRVFNLVADLQGYIRLNLKGREKQGIVEDGVEYDQLCHKISEGLKTFKDADTMETIVDDVKQKGKLFKKGKGFDNLPDLLLKWKTKPAANYRKIVSSEFGEIEWPMPGLNPDGRSGNHRPEGFVIAKGKNYTANSIISNRHIVDLAPTILSNLDIPKPIGMEGEVF